LGLEDGKEGGEEGELDAGDGGEAEEAVFDLGEELGVGGVVGAGGAEGDAREVAGGEAGDRSAGSVGVGGDGGGGDEAGVDDVAVVGVAVAEEVEEVGWGHGVSGGTVLLYRFGVVGCWLLERDLREAADAADSRRGIRVDAERALRMRWSVFSL